MNTSSQTAVQTPTKYEFIESKCKVMVYSGYFFVIVHYFLVIEVVFEAIIFLPWSWEGLHCDEMPPVYKLEEWVHSDSIFA